MKLNISRLFSFNIVDCGFYTTVSVVISTHNSSKAIMSKSLLGKSENVSYEYYVS